MKRIMIAALCVALAVLLGASVLAEGAYPVSGESEAAFAALLERLLYAYETPSEGDAQAIEAAVEAVGRANAADGEIAREIADHWTATYLNPDYRLYMYHGDGQATELAEAGLPGGADHAFVVLGYELKDGEMTDELIGRCEAAAAAARAWPESILVCSGGATGENNPRMHTEAGSMRDYLVERCGIDAARIHIDENAMTTQENAQNTLAILRAQDVHSFTIVTSGYHQLWGQALYNAMAALYRQAYGFSAQIVGNYNIDVEPSVDIFRHGDRIAIRQMASMLGFSEETARGMNIPHSDRGPRPEGKKP